MDASNPSCAICNSPAHGECPCESERLHLAVTQAQDRFLEDRMLEIRDWVIGHARQHILNAFSSLKSHRERAHSSYLSSLPYFSIYTQYSGQPPIHPAYLAQLRSQIAEANAEFQRGIDSDWKASVLRYPEVLDYFFSLIELRIPSDRSPSVAEPPFAAAGYADSGYLHHTRMGKGKKKKRREREASAGPFDGGGYREPPLHSVVGRAMRGPPPVPTPPIQPSGGYPRPPMYPYG